MNTRDPRNDPRVGDRFEYFDTEKRVKRTLEVTAITTLPEGMPEIHYRRDDYTESQRSLSLWIRIPQLSYLED